MRPATLLLVLATVAAYLVELAAGGNDVCQTYGFVAAHPSATGALRSLFLHDPSSWIHVGGNMAFLLVFGTLVERKIGSVRFLAVYFAAGFAGAIVHTIVNPFSITPMVGASGAVFGIMAAAAMLQPKLLVFVAVYFLFNLVVLFFPDMFGMGDVAVGCHIGGFVAGFLMTRIVFAGKVEEAV